MPGHGCLVSGDSLSVPNRLVTTEHCAPVGHELFANAVARTLVYARGRRREISLNPFPSIVPFFERL